MVLKIWNSFSKREKTFCMNAAGFIISVEPGLIYGNFY